MKPIIVSVYMDNIPEAVRQAQASVINKAKGPLPFEQIRTTRGHGEALDSIVMDSFANGFDTVMIIDIDCIPLQRGLQEALAAADLGLLAGPAQRANHIENGGHIYAGPAFMSFNKESYDRAKRPSFTATPRADVGEELTRSWNEKHMQVGLWMPKTCEEPLWTLRHDLPKFGRNTWFANERGGLVCFHAFASRENKGMDRFIEVCEQAIGAKKPENVPTS